MSFINEPAVAIQQYLAGASANCMLGTIWCPLCQFDVVTYMSAATDDSLWDYHQTVCINTTPKIREMALDRMFSKWRHRYEQTLFTASTLSK